MDHSTSFASDLDTYQEWIRSQRIKDLLDLFHNGLHDRKNMWMATDGAGDQISSDVFGVYHREVFDFEITLPATSSVTSIAYANSDIGKVPFEAGDDVISAKILEASVAKYGKQKS